MKGGQDARRLLTNSSGKPSQSSLIGVLCFFSPIFSYFCLFVAAFKPCHGRPPRRKYLCDHARESQHTAWSECSLAPTHMNT